MKKIAIFILTFLITILFSGCLPTNQAEQSLDFIFGSPRVATVEPKDGAENIDLNSEIKIKFNKEIDAETLNNRTVIVDYTNSDLGFNVNPFLGSEYKYENKTLTIKPGKEFLPNQVVEVKLTSEIKSKEGKELAHSGKSGETDNIRYAFKFKTAK